MAVSGSKLKIGILYGKPGGEEAFLLLPKSYFGSPLYP